MFQLHARVIEAKGLPTFDTTNIFATLFINENAQEKTEQNPSNNPNWNQAFDFNFTNINSAMLKVEVSNNNGLNNEKIGEVIIPLDSIQNLRQDIDLWYNIKDEQGNEKGSIHLILQITEENDSNDYDDNYFQQLITPTKYLISFTVISVEDIEKLTESKDFDYTPDFYVVLQMKGKKRIEKTVCKIANFQPVWNQTFKYHIEAKNLTAFNIKLKNHIIREDKDTIVAETNFDFCKIPKNTIDYNAWIELPSTTIKNEKCRLHVNIHFEETNDLSDDDEKDSELEIAFDKNNLFPEKVDLKVTILEARDLPHVDLLSGADPYCIAELGYKSYQTKTIIKSLSPDSKIHSTSLGNSTEQGGQKSSESQIATAGGSTLLNNEDASNDSASQENHANQKSQKSSENEAAASRGSTSLNSKNASNDSASQESHLIQVNKKSLENQTAASRSSTSTEDQIKAGDSASSKSQTYADDSMSPEGQISPGIFTSPENDTTQNDQTSTKIQSSIEYSKSQTTTTTFSSTTHYYQSTVKKSIKSENNATQEIHEEEEDSASQKSNTIANDSSSFCDQNTAKKTIKTENNTTQEDQNSQETQEEEDSASQKSNTIANDSSSLYDQNTAKKLTKSENNATQEDQNPQEIQEKEDDSASQKSNTIANDSSSLYDQNTAKKSIKSENNTTQEGQLSSTNHSIAAEGDSISQRTHSIANDSTSLYDQNAAEVSTPPKFDKASDRRMSPKNQVGGSTVSFRSEDICSVGQSSSPCSQKSHRSRGPPTKDERYERTIESYIGFNLRKEQSESCSSKCYSLYNRSQAVESEAIIEEEEEVQDQYDEQFLSDQPSNDDKLRQILLKEEEEFLSEIEERKNEIRQIVMADALKIYNENVLFPLQQTDMDLFDNDKNLDELKERTQNPEKMTQKRLDREILKLQEEITTIDDEIKQLRREIAELE